MLNHVIVDLYHVDNGNLLGFLKKKKKSMINILEFQVFGFGFCILILKGCLEYKDSRKETS